MTDMYAKFRLKGTTCYYSVYSENKCVTRFVKFSKLKEVPDRVIKSEMETDKQFNDRVRLIAKG